VKPLIPPRLRDKIAPGNPIERQFVPSEEEKLPMAGFSCNPVGDDQARKGSRLLHKYPGRCLLLTTAACAMHCRYCFRQHFDYDRGRPKFADELDLIRTDPSLREVILSGGDPLSLSNVQLGRLIKELDTIEHLKLLRFHTRYPIGIPERIDDGFLELLASTRLQIFFLIHSNCALELDDDVAASLKKIARLGIPVLNQSVLLKGVNDSEIALRELSERLIEIGVQPYYLHQLDKVAGAAHFEVEPARGLELVESLRRTLPGYAIPTYVREVAGEGSKMTITSAREFESLAS
jgi:EF-P beta-lysylation protein EpmB